MLAVYTSYIKSKRCYYYKFIEPFATDWFPVNNPKRRGTAQWPVLPDAVTDLSFKARIDPSD